MHVSTAYCNPPGDNIQEIVEPAHFEPTKLLEFVESIEDDKLVDVLTKRFFFR